MVVAEHSLRPYIEFMVFAIRAAPVGLCGLFQVAQLGIVILARVAEIAVHHINVINLRFLMLV